MSKITEKEIRTKLKEVIKLARKFYGNNKPTGEMIEELICKCGEKTTRYHVTSEWEWKDVIKRNKYCGKCGKKMVLNKYPLIDKFYWYNELTRLYTQMAMKEK